MLARLQSKISWYDGAHNNQETAPMTLRHPFKRQAARLAIAAATVSLLSGLSGQAMAQAYPSKPIKFVVPFSAGSATDAVGRIVAQAMGEALGQPTSVENKAGANGILGAEAVKASAGDGYTFLVTTSTTQAANVSLYKKLSYDPVKDFTPIGKIGETGFILMVQNDFPAKDMKEFIAHGKANPGKLAYGHGSSGSLVSAALLGQMAGLEFLSVPYKSIPPALTDLLSITKGKILSGLLKDSDLLKAKHTDATKQELIDKINGERPGFDVYFASSTGQDSLISGQMALADFGKIKRLDFVFGKNGLTNNTAPYIPLYLLNFGFNYDYKGFGVGANINFVAKQYTDYLNFKNETAEGAIGQLNAFNTIDLNLSYSFETNKNKYLNGLRLIRYRKEHQ
jgi:hypothetical protein